jgi:hypothetical protein
MEKKWENSWADIASARKVIGAISNPQRYKIVVMLSKQTMMQADMKKLLKWNYQQLANHLVIMTREKIVQRVASAKGRRTAYQLHPRITPEFLQCICELSAR